MPYSVWPSAATRAIPSGGGTNPQPAAAALSLAGKAPTVLAVGTYSTTFAATENPISESGAWAKNQSNAWQNILTSGGNALAAAYSNQTGNTDDAYSLLTALSGNDYELIATVLWAGANQGEVELLGRATDTSTQIQAYETLYNTAGGWQLVRWNGPLNSYDVIYPPGGALSAAYGGDGSQFRVQFVGNLYSMWDRPNSGASWTPRLSNFDLSSAGTWFSTGKPGIAVYVRSSSANISYVGLKDFQATAL